MNTYQCTVCTNIQETNDQCQCCGNTLFDECNQLDTMQPDSEMNTLQDSQQVKHIVIIGGGISSLSVIRQLIKSPQKNKYSITLISKESRLPYYRTAIPKIIHNPSFASQKQFTIEQQEFFEKNAINLKLQSEVIDIDSTKKIVYYQSNATLCSQPYDDLVFATGGESNVPPFIRNSDCDNLIPIHSLEDIQRIVNCFETTDIQHVVIIGAGLSGIEIAAELRRKYSTLSITLIEVANRILPRQLTEQASTVFTSVLKSHSIDLLTSCCVEKIEYDENHRLKVITSLTELHTDLICYSCGIHSNISLAQRIGCDCNRGILVDNHMKTSISSVYACGDCCEYNGWCFGNWTDAMKQGEICAETILGNDVLFTHSPMPYFVYCFIGVYSVGNLDGEYLLKQSDDSFIQLFFNQSKTTIVGGILIGKVISKIQRDLVRVVHNKISGKELNDLLHLWEQYI